MALSKTNISTSEVASALNTSGDYRVSYLCKHPNINKWAKYKPIRYPKSSGLVDGDFRSDWEGSDGDRAIGIFYGLQSRPEGGIIQDIHNINYDYVGRPTGGENSPFRLGDFRGYDKDAHCNLYGNCIKDKVELDDDQIPIFILYDANNTTGVDIRKITPNNSVADIGTYYPCIVIDHWMKALTNSTTNSYTTLRHNNQWYNNFNVNIDSSSHDQRLPFSTEGVRKVSFCLIEEIDSNRINLKQWKDIDQVAIDYYFVALPESTGLDMNFYYSTPLLKTDTISNANVNSFTIFFRHTMEASKAYTFRVTVENVYNQSSSYSFDIVKGAGVAWLSSFNRIIEWSKLNMIVRKGDKKTLKVIIQYQNKIINTYQQEVEVFL